MLAIEKVPNSMASVCSKLKRLKIQENMLMKNISTNLPHECYEDYKHIVFIENVIESKTDKNLKEMWILFSDLRTRTESDDLDDSDMIELKSDVLALETKIKNMKASLQVELSNVMKNEQQILNKIKEDMKPDMAEKKVRVQSFDNIVPSPVKIYRETPMKHDAVIEYDNFIQKHKKYDGWFEYNHNIFVQLWEKYFGIINPKAETDSDMLENIFRSNRFSKFKLELDHKVQGVMLSENDIIEHAKWYIQFCSLKHQKKEAIAIWQAKRNVFQRNFTNDFYTESGTKALSSKNQNSNLNSKNGKTSFKMISEPIHNQIDDIDIRETRSVTTSKKFTSDSLQRIQRPTKQWLIKCNVEDDVNNNLFGSVCEIDNLQKVKEPGWRASLKNIF